MEGRSHAWTQRFQLVNARAFVQLRSGIRLRSEEPDPPSLLACPLPPSHPAACVLSFSIRVSSLSDATLALLSVAA
eukprot:1463021-Pyramimonas_sp.AAC.1